MSASQYLPTARPEAVPDRDPIIDFGLRWWWLLALGVLLGGAAAYAYATYAPTTYQSTAYIQVIPSGGNATQGAGEARSASTNYAAAAASPLVFESTSQALGDQLPLSGAELQEMYRGGQISIGRRRNANFIDVTVTNKNPDHAVLIADTIAAVAVTTVNEQVGVGYEERQRELQQQIDFAREQLTTAAIFERRNELEQRLLNQETNLISLQANYQEEIERQAVDAAAIFDQQIERLEEDITATTEELDAVNARIAKLPAGTDPLVSGAMASAYASQVSTLTSQYVTREIVSLTATSPLVKYGDAADPFAISKLKKAGFFGVIIGGSIAAGFGLFIDLLRKRRRQETPVQHVQPVQPAQPVQLVQPVPETALNLNGLMQMLDQLEYTEAGRAPSRSERNGRPNRQ